MITAFTFAIFGINAREVKTTKWDGEMSLVNVARVGVSPILFAFTS